MAGKARGARKAKGSAKVGFPFGTAAGSHAFPFGAAHGYGPGVFAGFGGFGWIITFAVLFFIAIVFLSVWRGIGPLIGGLGGFFF